MRKKMKQNNACCVYDFTTFEGHDKCIQDIKDILKLHCKRWAFQEEKGEKTGAVHFQGRFSLKLKKYLTTIPFTIGSYSITSGENRDNDFYVLKENTRINGPWRNTDKELYIPRQIREIVSLYEWQRQVLEKCETFDKRTINCIYCPLGNIGKSILIGWIRAYSLGRALPPVNDYKDMLRMVCDLPTATSYFIDMPRAIKKDKLGGFYSAIETIKDGYAYDDRYSFKEKIFDCPNIWIFSNMLPDLNLLSQDRWKIWEVKKNTLISID